MVGIREVGDWEGLVWQKNDKSNKIRNELNYISRHTDDRVPGFYPLIIVAEDPEEINSRQVTEGGTGIYEGIEEKASIDTRDAALDYTNGLLRRYARIGKVVTFNTSQSRG